MMRAFKFLASKNPPSGVGAAFLGPDRFYGVVEGDADEALINAQQQAPEGSTLLPTGDSFDPPLGWERGRLHHMGDAE